MTEEIKTDGWSPIEKIELISNLITDNRTAKDISSTILDRMIEFRSTLVGQNDDGEIDIMKCSDVAVACLDYMFRNLKHEKETTGQDAIEIVEGLLSRSTRKLSKTYNLETSLAEEKFEKLFRVVTQPTDTSCVSACISMMTGLSIDIVMEEFRDQYQKHEIGIEEYLRKRTALPFYHTQIFDEETVSFVTVPSLNIRGMNHQILIVCHDDSWSIYDPNTGIEDKGMYSANPNKEDTNQFPLKSYHIDFSVDLDDLYNWRDIMGLLHAE
jgi:hypothetical protein